MCGTRTGLVQIRLLLIIILLMTNIFFCTQICLLIFRMLRFSAVLSMIFEFLTQFWIDMGKIIFSQNILENIFVRRKKKRKKLIFSNSQS